MKTRTSVSDEEYEALSLIIRTDPAARREFDKSAAHNGLVSHVDYLPGCPCDACLSRIRAMQLTTGVYEFTPKQFRRLWECKKAIEAGYYSEEIGS